MPVITGMALFPLLLHDSAMRSGALTDKKILMTRAAEHTPALAQLIRARAAVPLSFPCLCLQEMPQHIRAALPQLHDSSDVLFTSANGVHAVVAAFGADLSAKLVGKRVAAVGESTAQALQQHHLHVDLLPETASQDGLIAAYAAAGLPAALLFFRAQEGREALADALREQGVRVSTVAAYRTVCPDDDASGVIGLLEQHAIDAVLLGSPKTARFYLQRVGSQQLANRPVIAVISERMAAAAREMGLHVQVVAKSASFESMLDALAEHFDSIAA